MRLAAAVLSIVAGVGLALCRGHASQAQVIPRPPAIQMFTDMLTGQGNETGFTLDDVLDHNLWLLARHPLAPEMLDQVGKEVHRAPHRGVQFELLTPGDFGATVHFRW